MMTRLRNKGRFLVAGLLILVAVVYLIVTSTGSTARYTNCLFKGRIHVP
jgi:hypothetical protein